MVITPLAARAPWSAVAIEAVSNTSGVELALLHRSKDAREGGMRRGAAFGAIAATDLAGDDGGAKRLRGTPVGRVVRIGFEEKCTRPGIRSRGAPQIDVCGARSIEEGFELVLEMPACDGDCRELRPCL